MWPRLFWASIAVYVVLRGLLYFASYTGSTSPALRARVERHFSADEIAQGQRYSRRGFALRIVAAALDLALLLIALMTPLAAWLSDRASAWTGGRWWLQAPLFVAVATVALAALHLPLGYYFGLVLEKRFGFSNLTLGGWLLLQAKNLAVSLVVSCLAALLWFGLLRALPRLWVAVVPVAFLAFQAVMVLLVPMVFLPLYYRASPLPDGPFRGQVLEVLRRARVPVEQILVIDESRYSSHTNAFFTGFGPSRKICLDDTLLADHGEGEALTVVAHEAGHWARAHVLKGMLLGTLALLLGCVLLGLAYPGLARALSFRPLVDPASLPAIVLLATVAGLLFAPLDSAISRRFEREADRASLDLTGDRRSFVAAEERLARTNHSQLLPHPLVVFWSYSHPPAIERIEAAERCDSSTSF
jgi:STE24 endopeptidase